MVNEPDCPLPPYRGCICMCQPDKHDLKSFQRSNNGIIAAHTMMLAMVKMTVSIG